MDRHRYIVVEGPIGVGKTSLATLLAERLGARAVFERVEDNPFLPAFYAEREKMAFQTQLFFLLSRFRQQEELWQEDLFSSATVSDYLFAKDRLFAALNLSAAEMTLYDRIYQMLGPRTVKPDLVVYLQARLDVLLARIRRRGREYERRFDPDYLAQVVEAYNDFFFHWTDTPLLVVNTSDIDFVESEADLERLLAVIQKHRRGLQHYIPAGGTRHG